MRTSVIMLASAVILVLGLGRFAQPAAADPVHDSGCQPGGLHEEYCFEAHGVLKEKETRSGET